MFHLFNIFFNHSLGATEADLGAEMWAFLWIIFPMGLLVSSVTPLSGFFKPEEFQVKPKILAMPNFKSNQRIAVIGAGILMFSTSIYVIVRYPYEFLAIRIITLLLSFAVVIIHALRNSRVEMKNNALMVESVV